MSERTQNLTENAVDLANQARELSDQAAAIAIQASEAVALAASGHDASFFLSGLTVFILACFIGYYVVWHVTPALHSPLMGITNAISSVIIVGALVAAGSAAMDISTLMGFLAVILASINIFGGFIVTQRMLHMFKKKA